MDAPFTIGGSSVGQIGMTLSAIAYANGPSAIAALLADQALATAGQWSLVWTGADDANQVFVARHAASGQQAIAVRGSVSDPRELAFWLDWFQQDFSVFKMADWPYGGAPDGARLSHGSILGLASLLTLEDANGQTLVAFCRANPTPGLLSAVVGHSLGGALAYALAPYLQQELAEGQSGVAFWPVTFAAPTAGNATFAGWLEQSFAAAGSRYFNDVDVVPHAWSALDWIASSFPGGPHLPLVLKGIVEQLRVALKLLRDQYAQPGAGVPLTGTVVTTDDWVHDAGLQHVGSTYLSLLHAPPVPVQSPPTAAGAGR